MAQQALTAFCFPRGWELNREQVLELLAAWRELKQPLAKFLKGRDLSLDCFYDAVRKHELVDAYYETRTNWQRELDMLYVQQALVNVLAALEAGDVETSKWVLERRVPLHFATPEIQMKIAERLKFMQSNDPGGEGLDLPVVGVRLDATSTP
jgi:hypothetical protein